MIVSKENGVIAESWLSAQTDAQRALDEAHPDWLPADHADAVGRLARSCACGRAVYFLEGPRHPDEATGRTGGDRCDR